MIKSVKIIMQLWRKLHGIVIKEVLLKAVFDNVQRTTPYSYDNEVSSFPIDNELI